ncbi:response regulator transcription factor [Prolixibacteraceae bacterium JC049]|nr:response regulator transcription factor [Prolixibacteraceae bacterium JC049]
MRIIIIEDEVEAAGYLCDLIETIDQDLVVVAVIESVEIAHEWLTIHDKPDLIFMDIKLADGLCFELFEQIELDVPVIFTTAYDDYTIKAFEYCAVDYLLKPIKKEKLEDAIEKYKKYFQQKEVMPDVVMQMRKLVDGFQSSNKYPQRILVNFRDEILPVSVDNIAFFFVENRNVFMHCFDNTQYLMTQTLAELEDILDPKCFYRANRKFIVSMDAVKKIKPTLTQKIIIDLQPEFSEKVVVSRLKVRDFTSWLSQ